MTAQWVKKCPVQAWCPQFNCQNPKAEERGQLPGSCPMTHTRFMVEGGGWAVKTALLVLTLEAPEELGSQHLSAPSTFSSKGLPVLLCSALTCTYPQDTDTWTHTHTHF